MVPVGEPVDVADLDEEPGGRGRSDAVQVHQGGAGLDDELLDLLVEGLGALIDLLQIADQFEGDAFAGLADQVAGPHPGEQDSGLGRRQVLLRAARNELEQQLMDLGDHPVMVLTESAAAVSQDPQQVVLLVVDDRPQTVHPHRDHGDRVRIVGVGLAALAGVEHPQPCRQLRRYVHHLFAGPDQPARDVPADPVAALDRPQPVGPLLGASQQLFEPATGGVEPLLRRRGIGDLRRNPTPIPLPYRAER